MKTARQHKQKRRGSVLLEFALTLPLALLLMVTSVDLGRLILIQTTLQDAASVSARAGARLGYAGNVPLEEGKSLCDEQGAAATANPSYDAFCAAYLTSPIGGYTLNSFEILSPGVLAGGRYCQRGTADPSNLFVTVQATASMAFMTPGLRQLVEGVTPAEDATLTVTAVARCENAR